MVVVGDPKLSLTVLGIKVYDLPNPTLAISLGSEYHYGPCISLAQGLLLGNELSSLLVYYTCAMNLRAMASAPKVAAALKSNSWCEHRKPTNIP